MTHTLSSAPKTFDWPLAFEAENFVRERIAQFLTRNSYAQKLSERMRDETGTDFFEWVDHLVVSSADEKQLRELGFAPDKASDTANGALVLQTSTRHIAAIYSGPESSAKPRGCRTEA